MTNQIQKFNSELGLAGFINKNYKNQIQNYFSDNQKAMEFLSNIRAEVQRNPKLLNCEPTSLINSFMTMASLKLMPSGVSGEAYVLPYKDKAQFQLGYQGLVTLFYRAGVKSIAAEIVYKKDKFSYDNGKLEHSPDVFAEDRGEAIGAYVIAELQSGGRITKVMKKKDIIGIGKKFSKSFNTDFTPWKESNDPELWMWKKTVLKQAAKLVPKNETIFKAIAEDNQDSNISDKRIAEATKESESLKMGNLLKSENKNEKTKETTKDKAQPKPADSDEKNREEFEKSESAKQQELDESVSY